MTSSISKPTSFSPIKRRMVYDELYDQIVSMISEGELKPGDRLPPERELAKQLKVSRQSIREALKKAETQGLVEVRHGEGTFVRSLVSQWMEEPLLIMITEGVGKVNEFLEIRKVLEVWCAKKAAEVVTPRDLKKLAKSLIQMEKVMESLEIFGGLDFDFHLGIVEASHNTLLFHMFSSLKHVFDFKYKISNIAKNLQEKNSILHRQHQDLYEAIKSRDSELAGQKMEAHLQFVEKEWIQDIQYYQAKQTY